MFGPSILRVMEMSRDFVRRYPRVHFSCVERTLSSATTKYMWACGRARTQHHFFHDDSSLLWSMPLYQFLMISVREFNSAMQAAPQVLLYISKFFKVIKLLSQIRRVNFFNFLLITDCSFLYSFSTSDLILASASIISQQGTKLYKLIHTF